MKGEKHMKKYYKLNFKNYILMTLYIISIIILLAECPDLKTLVITKIIGLTYFIIFTFKNIDEHGDIYHDIGKLNPWVGVLFSFRDKKIADIAISSRLKCKLKQRAKTLRRKSYESR